MSNLEARNRRIPLNMLVTKERDRVIDVLRFIAIMCIIIAHSVPNDLVFQIRNFDVVLMVLLMGISFYLSQGKRDIDYGGYVKKRFTRLIMSTWVFILFFFLLFFVLSLLIGDSYYFDIKTIILSFGLNGGIGYVWIMYVFFIVALCSPLIISLSKKINSQLKYFLILFGAYCIYQIVIIASEHVLGGLYYYFQSYVLTPFGYCLVAGIGIRFKQLAKQQIVSGMAIFLCTFIGLMLYHNFEPIQSFKYPPTLYFMSYGLFVGFSLYLLLEQPIFKKILFNNFIIYYSKKSLNLYFWHIIPIYIIEMYGDKIPYISGNFTTRFLFIFVSAALLTVINGLVESRWHLDRVKKNFHVT